MPRSSLFVALLVLAGCGGGDGDGDAFDSVERWNLIALNASGLDHAPGNVGPPHTFGEQLGPCRASRAMAIVHIAIFEAINAIEGGFQSYAGRPPAPAGASMEAAVAQAAHDTLAAMFPSQAAIFDGYLGEDLGRIAESPAKADGIATGQGAAAAILQIRTNDGSETPEQLYGSQFVPNLDPGHWRQDPISLHPLALGCLWNQVAPFVMTSASQFRAPAPPAMTSAEYTAAYDEAQRLGGDGVVTPTQRTPEQTVIGTWWAYDGTPSLCAPPRLYNQITAQLARERGVRGADLARLLAVVNVAMADAGIAVWDSKYFYKLWRPVAGIRESDPGTGPTGLGDGNPATIGDVTFTPLGAPASNLNAPNFTPPFPAYPSGHAGFGGALFQVLRRWFGTDDIAFTFVSDEFNGITRDNQGVVRPFLPRSFTSLSQAEEENGQSRIYLGIHWSFDKTAGIAQGNLVGDLVFDSLFPPLP